MGVLAVNTLRTGVVGVYAGSPTGGGEYRSRVCAARTEGISLTEGRQGEGASETVAARVASEKASSPTPLGLAPERQSGLRALIIAQRLVGEGAARFSPPLATQRYQSASLSSSHQRRLAAVADGWGGSPPLRPAVDDRRGREEEPPHGLSLRVAALQHSRLPRPFRGAGTSRGLYTRTYARTRARGPPIYTRPRVHTARTETLAHQHLRGRCGGEPPEEVSILALLSDHRGATQVTPFVHSSAPADRRRRGRREKAFLSSSALSSRVHSKLCTLENVTLLNRRTLSRCLTLVVNRGHSVVFRREEGSGRQGETGVANEPAGETSLSDQ